jgi:drug/metabolite transporter (DMT)-like permease
MMAFFSTVLPTWLLSEAVRRIGAGRAALCGMIGPVTTVVLEAGLLGETVGLSDAVGTALVIASVLWLTRAN